MAKKENSQYDGTLIQIKRTSLDITDQKVKDDGILKYGEPLYLDKEQFIAIGDSGQNITSQLKVFSADFRDLAKSKVFYNDLDKSNRAIFLRELSDGTNENNSSQIYPKLRMLTQRDADGKPVDSSKKIIYIPKSATNWKKIDKDGKITGTSAKQGNVVVCPAAIKIKISDMGEDIIPFISLAIDNAVWADASSTSRKIKDLKKSFGNITSIYSYTESDGKSGGIVVCCGIKPIKEDLYIDVFGG